MGSVIICGCSWFWRFPNSHWTVLPSPPPPGKRPIAMCWCWHLGGGWIGFEAQYREGERAAVGAQGQGRALLGCRTCAIARNRGPVGPSTAGGSCRSASPKMRSCRGAGAGLYGQPSHDSWQGWCPHGRRSAPNTF